MATAAEKKILRTKLELYEGVVDHMYLDTKGFVTVGIGHLLKDVAAAQKLSFVHQKDNKKATIDEIKTDFDTVKKQVKGLFASSYKKHTKLKLQKITIDELTNQHIDTFEKELKVIYEISEFDAYPSGIRLALFDMIFNLGMTKLKNTFPTFNKKVKAKKWGEAATESKRTGIGAARNKYVKDLFESAAKAAVVPKKP